MLQLLADVTQESLCVWALQQPLGRFRAKGRRNKDEIDSPFFLAVSSSWRALIFLTLEYQRLLMFALPGLLFCTFHLAHPGNFLRSWLLILGLLNRLTLLKARLQMGDVDFSHVLQDRHRLLDAEGSDGIYRLARLAFGFFSTAGFKSVVLLHTRKPERKWKIQSMRFSRLVGLQIFAYSSVLRCSSAD